MQLVPYDFAEEYRDICFVFLQQALSQKYYETKFAKLNVDKAKFFVNKLSIRVLPVLICFKKGLVVDR